MSRQVFVTPEGRPLGRWLEAFPDARVVNALPRVTELLDSGGVVFVLNIRLDALTEFLRKRPDALGVVLSLRPGKDDGAAAFESGARGYGHALAAVGELRDIEAVISRGGLWLGPELMAAAIRRVGDIDGQPVNHEILDQLTARELEVASALVRGASNREISGQLQIAERTVKAHLGTMYEKFGVRDRLQLAIRLGSAGLRPD